MPRRTRRIRKSPAQALCRHFEDTDLVGCARAGLEALESEHKPLVTGGARIGCGVPLDRCRQPHEEGARRWDYVFVIRDTNSALGVEVHHAAAEEVAIMIEKKRWAENLLSVHTPRIKVEAWCWVAAPNGEIFFPRQHPLAWKLADAGISYPVKQLSLP
jgi:hypothetical protein